MSKALKYSTIQHTIYSDSFTKVGEITCLEGAAVQPGAWIEQSGCSCALFKRCWAVTLLAKVSLDPDNLAHFSSCVT